MNIKTFVINLPKSTDRQKNMVAHLDKMKIDFEFFDAVDGRALSQQYVDSVFDKTTAEKTWKPMNRGELGCSLSNMGIYEKMIAENIGEAIIFEDDAIIMPDFNKIMNKKDQWLPQDADIVLLGSRFVNWVKNQKLSKIDSKHNIGKMYFIAGATYGYYITLAGAKKILNKNKPIIRAIDDITGDAVFGKHNLYAILPPIVDFADEESTIGYDGDVLFNGVWFSMSKRRMIINYKLPIAPFILFKKIEFAIKKIFKLNLIKGKRG